MFKRLLTLSMVVAIFSVQANAASTNGLKAAFDELNYSLSVEWDQKDQAFYKAQLKQFNSTIQDLKAQGLTDAEMTAFAASQIKDAQTAKDVQAALNTISVEKMGSEEASALILSTLKKSSTQGASWNGDASLLLYLGIGIVVIALALGAGSYSGGGYYEDDYYYDDCYYDYYWGYTCY